MKAIQSITIIFIILAAISTVAQADDRILSCSNKSGKIEIDICGIKGCPATLKIASKTTKYNLRRVKNSDGSLTYRPRPGSRPVCTIQISRLSLGKRKLITASCASALRNATCQFVSRDSDSSSSNSSTSSTTSSDSSGQSSSQSSSNSSTSSTSSSSSSSSSDSSDDDDSSSSSKSS